MLLTPVLEEGCTCPLAVAAPGTGLAAPCSSSGG